MANNKTHIYLVPGLAASPKIFQYLDFPEEKFEIHYLEWLIPLSQEETIEGYAKRMSESITEKNPVLIGVSFGGIMVQEISKHVHSKKVVIISSVKSRNEFPKRLKFLLKTKIYKLFPAKSFANFDNYSMYIFGVFAKKKLNMYKEYLSVRDENYLIWSIEHVLNWKQTKPIVGIIHIHGTKDHVFPIKHISNCIEIENAKHAMILNKAKKISKIICGKIMC